MAGLRVRPNDGYERPWHIFSCRAAQSEGRAAGSLCQALRWERSPRRFERRGALPAIREVLSSFPAGVRAKRKARSDEEERTFERRKARSALGDVRSEGANDRSADDDGISALLEDVQELQQGLHRKRGDRSSKRDDGSSKREDRRPFRAVISSEREELSAASSSSQPLRSVPRDARACATPRAVVPSLGGVRPVQRRAVARTS
jgi:hypothetical protein